MASIPAVTPIVAQPLNEKSTGAGESAARRVGAMGNAFFDATGVRPRQFPLTSQLVLATLKSASDSRLA